MYRFIKIEKGKWEIKTFYGICIGIDIGFWKTVIKIEKNFHSEEDVREWFENYRSEAYRIAGIAANKGISKMPL